MKKIIVFFIILSFYNAFSQGPGCPFVNAGNDVTVGCNNPCTNLTATFHQTGNTNSYTVTAIPYNPPFSYSGGTPVSVNTDDVWSGVINLPFTFCFYGQAYNQVVVGSNGVVSFNTSYANGYCPWSFSSSVPSPNLPLNAIFGAYVDIDPSVCGNVYYQITGTYPCRVFVFKFNQVCYFSCTSLKTSQMIVLYEGTNVIEVYIQNHPVCSNWNSGNAVVGIQNANGTQGITPPGYNTGPWTGNNLAWRFTPNGGQNYTITWFDQNNNVIGNTPTINVCPNSTTTYTAQVTYNICNNITYTTQDQVVVNVTNSANAGPDFSVCGLTTTLNATIQPGDVSYFWSCNNPNVTFNPVNSPNATVTVPSSGTYTFTWTTINSQGVQCSDDVQVTFTEPPTSTFTATPITCYGQPSTITYTGNAGPNASFNWNFGTGANIISGTGAGPYVVTWDTPGNITISLGVSENHCFSPITTVNLNQPTPINVSISTQPVTCPNGTNGSVNINVDGGSPPYSYTWSSGNGTNFPAGSYTVTITDSHNCTKVESFEVTEPDPLAVIPNQNNLMCFEDNSGSASVQVSGGTPPYSYQWTNNVSNTNTAVNLSAGNYEVTITDFNGCTSTHTFNISQPLPLTISSESKTDPTCFNYCNGSISINVTGGTAPYAYLWSNNNTQPINQQLCAGNHTVTITDANGCTYTKTYTLNNPPELQASIINYNNLLCYNQCTGSATVDVLNGTPPYTYNWSNNTNVNPATNLCSGNYTVTVYDVLGCSTTASVTISQPSQLTAQVENTIETVCFGECNGTAVVNTTGGTPPYSYQWSGIPSVTNVNDQLCAGIFSVTVTDANNCTTTTFGTIDQPSDLVISGSHTNLTCYGSNDGTITITANGATPPYQYFIQGDNNTTGQFNNLSAGNYVVTVTDSRGCSKTASITINQPDSLIISGQTYYSVCYGEWIYPSVSVTGGTPNYTFYWNNTQGSSSIALQPHSNSSFNVYATDANGCTSNNLTINIAVSAPLVIDLSANPSAVCPGEPVQIDISYYAGGGPPYLITNQSGNILTPPIIIYPQESGNYILSVKDVCGSIATDSVYITVYPLPVVNFVSDVVNGCEPLPVTFHVSSSEPGQQYIWDFGDGSVGHISYEQNPTHIYENDGIYNVTLTITSSHGCTNSYTHNEMIRVYPKPTARFIYNPEVVSIVKPEVNFKNLSKEADWYIWSFGDGDSSNAIHPYHWYKNVGVYLVQLIALTNKGCKDTAISYVTVRPEYTFYAPTYISPDYDNINDVFFVIGTGITSKNFKMYIFDRWGEIVYETDKYDPADPSKYGWDGTIKNKMAPVGTYTWYVRYTDPDNIVHEVAGSVTVIR
jgi:gliding motility-associated-like protein